MKNESMVFIETSERNKAYFVTNDINSICENLMDYCNDLENSTAINKNVVKELQVIRDILKNAQNVILSIDI